MPVSTVYSALTEEDAALSGPHVWPKLMADHAVDRFIFRRPELPYLVAKKRLLATREEKELPYPDLMGIRFRRHYYGANGYAREQKGVQRFAHAIKPNNKEEDVRAFLHTLRAILNRNMPDRPIINCSIQLRFYDVDHPKAQILSWQERWL